MSKREVINTAESATRNGTGPLLASSTDVASTEDKTPGCTIAYVVKQHPFSHDRIQVFVRGEFADGQYGPFPADEHGVPFAKSPDKATNAPGGKLRQVRLGGAYAVHSGSWRTGYVFDAPASVRDDLTAWLDGQKAKFEARIPQVAKPAQEGKSKAKLVLPE